MWTNELNKLAEKVVSTWSIKLRPAENNDYLLDNFTYKKALLSK